MAIYLRLPNIEGNVTHQDYRGWIRCTDIEFDGIHNIITQVVGQRKDRVQHYPSFGEFTLLKPIDKSSIALFEYACHRQVFETADIHFVTSGNPDYSYAKYHLLKVIISRFSESYHQSSSSPFELIKLAYTSIEKTYIPRDADNTIGSPIVSGYNLETGQLL